MIDSEALEEAIINVAKDQLMREIHEWIVYTAPVGVNQLYKEYLDIVNRKQNEELINNRGKEI